MACSGHYRYRTLSSTKLRKSISLISWCVFCAIDALVRRQQLQLASISQIQEIGESLFLRRPKATYVHMSCSCQGLTIALGIVPPYGQDIASELQSIFDVKHLKARAYFLNSQCAYSNHYQSAVLMIFRPCTDRMPVPLGEFISEHVYNHKLQSLHSIRDTSCIKFVDVSKGIEQQQGKSWTVSTLGILSFVH